MLQVFQCFLEHLCQLCLDVRSCTVYLLHLIIHYCQQFFKLILTLLQIRIHFIDLRGYFCEIV